MQKKVEIYLHLAHRLGMNNVKSEMDDIIFQTLEPKTHKEIKKKVRDSKRKRENYISKFIYPIKKELDNIGLEAEVYGRAKNLSSVFYKMQNRSKDFDEIFDLFAIRIIVSEKDACYVALGLIHELYKPVQDRFKDYIATPKGMGINPFTTVVGESEKWLKSK